MSAKMQLVHFARLLLCLVVCRDLWHTYSDALAASKETLITSVSDANLMYELIKQWNMALRRPQDKERLIKFLLRKLVIDEDSNVGMQDKEMASMKLGRVFLSRINDDIPKTVPGMQELLIMFEEEQQSFNEDTFETLILGIIYSAYQAHEKRQESQQQAWAGVLGRLANVTLRKL